MKTLSKSPADWIETERLHLVAPSVAYAADCHAYGSDPVFCEYLDAEPSRGIDDAAAFLRALIADNASGKRIYWLITLGDRAIGSLGFNMLFNPKHLTQDFGYGIGSEYWGRGYFNEAAGAVLDYGFNTLRLHRIQATTRADNRRSVAGLERLGFRHEATHEEFYQTADGRRDAAVWAKLAH